MPTPDMTHEDTYEPPTLTHLGTVHEVYASAFTATT